MSHGSEFWRRLRSKRRFNHAVDIKKSDKYQRKDKDSYHYDDFLSKGCAVAIAVHFSGHR